MHGFRITRQVLLLTSIVMLGALMLAPAITANAAAPTTPACTLLSKEEVKTHLAWPSHVDGVPLQEDALPNGSSCAFPSVVVQILNLPAAEWSTWLTTFKTEPNEAVPGVGDEAWVRNNRKRHAEFAVRKGTQVVTLQYSYTGSSGEPYESAKLAVIALGKAYAAKLR